MWRTRIHCDSYHSNPRKKTAMSTAVLQSADHASASAPTYSKLGACAKSTIADDALCKQQMMPWTPPRHHQERNRTYNIYMHRYSNSRCTHCKQQMMHWTTPTHHEERHPEPIIYQARILIICRSAQHPLRIMHDRFQQEEFQQSLIISPLQHSAVRLYLNHGSALLADHTSKETLIFPVIVVFRSWPLMGSSSAGELRQATFTNGSIPTPKINLILKHSMINKPWCHTMEAILLALLGKLDLFCRDLIFA